MPRLVCDMTVTADGYTAGPNQNRENPFGEVSLDDMHGWMFVYEVRH